MKKKFIKTLLKGVYVHGAKDVGTRTVNLLMGEHAGEYVRGDIMDANAVIQAFDELKGNVDNDHDSLEEVVDELHNLRDATDQSFEVFQEKAEEETANRIHGDKTLDQKIDQKEKESKERDNVLQQNIDTEKQERVNADTQLRNDLNTEINRAKAKENALTSDIQAEATKRENDDNTIKDNLNAEVTRATAKENEIKAEVDVINGDSTTEGSFRKAIADVVGAAPEAYDTLKEIADKLNENDDLHAAINDAIATKATTVALNEEITRAKAAEAENKAEIAAEAARAKQVEGNNALAIQNETSRATTAETAINEAVSTEVERAKGQEAYLQNLVNTKADTTALEGAKTELDKKISDETTRATAEEDELRSLITTEQNRATASEKSIADDLNGKLANKADTTTLNEQVDMLNAAISAKQDAGDYALKTDLPTVPTKTSQLTNDSNFITAADIDFTPYATIEALTAVEQRVTANTAAITNVTVSKGIPYDSADTVHYKIDRSLKITENGLIGTISPASIYLCEDGVGPGTFKVDTIQGITQTTPYFDFSLNNEGLSETIRDDGSKFKISPSQILLQKDDTNFIKVSPDEMQLQKDGSNIIELNYGVLQYNDIHGNNFIVGQTSNGIFELEMIGHSGSAATFCENGFYIRDGIGADANGIYRNPGGMTYDYVYNKRENLINVGTFIGRQFIDPEGNLRDGIKKVEQEISAKQNKIIPIEVDVAGIGTASIEQLRTIVSNLINALSSSGLITTVETA